MFANDYLKVVIKWEAQNIRSLFHLKDKNEIAILVHITLLEPSVITS